MRAATHKGFLATAAAVVCLVLAPAAAQATSILYAATNLAEALGADDLWQYDYTLESFDHSGASHTLAILFPWESVIAIEVPLPAVGAEWTSVVVGLESPYALQPDPLLSSDGSYNAELQFATPTLPASFSVQFTWQGSGVPESQGFEVYDSGFNLVESGTTAPVPEPGTAATLLLGLALLAGHRRKRAGASY